MRLKQKLSPNKVQTGFISDKYIAIMIEPLDKTILTAYDFEPSSESVSLRYSYKYRLS